MTKVHLIGNAHLDPVWLWRWQEGCSEVLATFRSALDRMKEFNDYIFTCAGAAYYRWIEEIDPDMFEEIRTRVQEGRWVITGGWWIQPDCNAPSAESFARHALYSQRYYLEKFGRKAEIGYNVDSFGHSAMLPQLLRLSGLRGYVFMRPAPHHEMKFPFEQTSFLWESPDGTRIPTFRISHTYTTPNPEQTLKYAALALERTQTHSLPDMCFYGVGNHGGGPTIEILKCLQALISENPDCFEFSSPNRFFDELSTASLPILRDELQHHASGCYTTVMEIKELNRKAEQRLAAAEKLASLAAWLGFPVDTSALSEAWKTVLFNQFHDVMGGCSIREAMDDAVTDLRHALHVAQQITNRALQTLAWNINTSRGVSPIRNKQEFRLWMREELGTPLTVFNPHSWTVKTLVRTGFDGALARFHPMIENSDGTNVPCQRVRGAVTNGRNERWDSVFTAEIPPMGWKTFWIKRSPTAPALPSEKMLSWSDTHLENDFLRAEFDPHSGALISLFDKTRSLELLKCPTRELVLDDSAADTWAHNIFAFRDVTGEFGNAEVKLMEAGSVYARLKITSRFENSTIRKYVTLCRDLPHLLISYQVTWNEPYRILKLAFPTPFDECEVSGIAGGALRRTASGNEEPMQHWVRMGALGIVTDTRAAYDALQGEIRLTALRSPSFADHYGARDEYCEPMAQGEHHFELALTACGDSLTLSRLAAEMVCPPERILGTYHEGRLAENACGMDVQGSVLVDAVKPAEDGNGWIVRLREALGTPCDARIQLTALNRTIETALAPWQINTLRVTPEDIRETDFTEQ